MAIKLSNDVKLTVDSIDGIKGIDTSNVLASNARNVAYTATEDCYCMFYADNGYGRKTGLTDGVLVWSSGIADATNNITHAIYPLRKGQIATNTGNARTTIYGLK